MQEILKGVGWAVIWSLVWVAFGVLARYLSWLFCLGYGC